jgi:hypothetical protein
LPKAFKNPKWIVYGFDILEYSELWPSRELSFEFFLKTKDRGEEDEEGSSSSNLTPPEELEDVDDEINDLKKN